jgi:hypothetical protein
MPKSLKLVEPVEKPDPVKDYEPLFLSSVNILDIYWGQTCEVLGPCIDDAIHGEMTLDDIYNRIKAGQMYCLVFKNDDGELRDEYSCYRWAGTRTTTQEQVLETHLQLGVYEWCPPDAGVSIPRYGPYNQVVRF